MLALDTSYRTGSRDLVQEFYRPCLGFASRYDRAAGYFRSSVFTVVRREVAEFFVKGGKMRLICSVDLDASDYEAICAGLKKRDIVVGDMLVRQIDGMIAEMANYSGLEILATAIKYGFLDIKIAMPTQGVGIYHEKIGVFGDDLGNVISFIGSANETYSGWMPQGNYESIEVFWSWGAPVDASRALRHHDYFERLWDDNVPGVSVLPFDNRAKEKIEAYALKSIHDIVPSLRVEGNKMSARKPLPHQVQALQGWANNGFRGILEHATGSGKTFTAIQAIKSHCDGGGSSLILVPSELLLKQWDGEIRRELGDATVLLCGGGHSSWRERGKLRIMTEGKVSGYKRVVIAVMNTAATDEFRSRLGSVAEMLLVADEVHQIGSPHLGKCMEIQAAKRLGLSATPKRYGDEYGTSRIMEFFGGGVEPKFTLIDAIKSGRLVEYEYYPVMVGLDADEERRWIELSERIRILRFKEKAAEDPSNVRELIKRIQIRRSRIVKKAREKIRRSVDVIAKTFEEGEHWLVYCEDQVQIDEIREGLLGCGISALVYHSGLTDVQKVEVLGWFHRFGGVLLAIRCLDEGVDIPKISVAVIIASSQNPRQFIQRRGRVLRSYEGKNFAKIFDMLVVPSDVAASNEYFALLKAELMRASEFAAHSVNRYASIELLSLAERINFALNLGGEEMEDDDG